MIRWGYSKNKLIKVIVPFKETKIFDRKDNEQRKIIVTTINYNESIEIVNSC